MNLGFVKREWMRHFLHCGQTQYWAPWGWKSTPWALFLPNNNEPVVLEKPQVLLFLLCHSRALGVDVLMQKTRGRKDLITYNKAHGTTTMKIQVEHENQEVSSRYYREVLVRRLIPPSLSERNALTPSGISSFLSSSLPYKKYNEQPKSFIEDLVLLIAKGYHHLSSVRTSGSGICLAPRPTYRLSFTWNPYRRDFARHAWTNSY